MSSILFESVLIANRGEIACRVIATCRRLGIQTVAVYSDADANARHVRLADRAVRVGPAPARESYLSIEKVIEAAVSTGAQAVHPGYGFLSENAEFAEACERAGLVFIGPPADAIRAMGSKAAAKILMRDAGVPLTPGYDGPNQDPDFLQQAADNIGYPVMIKANAGGGGKGMRRVDSRAAFQASLASCRREAAAAFGDDAVLIEKYLAQPRHIEVQIFADAHGEVVSLYERDCSVQRRHQKVIEEAPPPGLLEDQRLALSRAGCAAARAVGYRNAGTVEFLMDQDRNVYFMEMNTRLQVEHPVTEMITGLDLVEWQLRVAAGQPLPLRQDAIPLHGHAIEVRLYAEDPGHDFMPSTGRLAFLRFPASTPHVRIDTGVDEGDRITTNYDPMIAKLITWDESRDQALLRMRNALESTMIVGVSSNTGFLHSLVTSPSFTHARLDTSLIEREQKWIDTTLTHAPHTAVIAATLALLSREAREEGQGTVSPWDQRDGWRLNGIYTRELTLEEGESLRNVTVEYRPDGYAMKVDGDTYPVSGEVFRDGSLDVVVAGTRARGLAMKDHESFHVLMDGRRYRFRYRDPLMGSTETYRGEASLVAPMPGRVVQNLVEAGSAVEGGAPLMILEAMKMECTIYAPAAGTVVRFHFVPGDQVNEGAELLEFERADTGAAEKV